MREKQIRKILIVLGSIFVLAFALAPVSWMLLVSFSKNLDFVQGEPYIPTLNNFRDILQKESLHFTDFLINSLVISGISAVISTFIGALAAYGLSRIRIKGKMLVLFFVLALSMFPQISIVGYLFKIMKSLGWINTYQALILPYVASGLPLGVWILMSYFSQIPQQLDEAAQVDGAGRLRTLFEVVLPISLPGLLSAALLLFIFSFNEFLFALMLTSDHHARTVPVGIALFQGLHGEIPWGYIMASSVVASAPVILIALAAQRYVVAGLTGGSVK